MYRDWQCRTVADHTVAGIAGGPLHRESTELSDFEILNLAHAATFLARSQRRSWWRRLGFVVEPAQREMQRRQVLAVTVMKETRAVA